MKTIDSLGNLKGKRVLVRSDFNVPLDADKNITDDGRIQAALPTLRALLDAGAKVIITAHLGRPKGQVNPDYSLAPVAKRLAEVTGAKVTLAEDTVGESAKAAVAAVGDGEIVLLENVRFNAAETSKDDAEREAFAAELAALADVFVSDGFGVVHRKQASVYDVAKLLPSAAGLLVVKEIESLGRAVNDPERPYTVVLGGSKVSDKLGVISNLLSKADRLLIGGGMAYTFLAAQGYEVGTSLLEKDQIDTVKGYLETAKAIGVELKDHYSGKATVAQVSMNLVNYEKTAIYRAFEAVKMEARRYGVNVLESEIVGVVPMQSLIDCAEYYLQACMFGPMKFDAKKQIMENWLLEDEEEEA